MSNKKDDAKHAFRVNLSVLIRVLTGGDLAKR